MERGGKKAVCKHENGWVLRDVDIVVDTDGDGEIDGELIAECNNYDCTATARLKPICLLFDVEEVVSDGQA